MDGIVTPIEWPVPSTTRTGLKSSDYPTGTRPRTSQFDKGLNQRIINRLFVGIDLYRGQRRSQQPVRRFHVVKRRSGAGAHMLCPLSRVKRTEINGPQNVR